MNVELKKELSCILCSMILNEPMQLPCDCLCCRVHLFDHNGKKQKIKCIKCSKDFDIPTESFPVANKAVQNILSKELFLSEKEKSLKKEVYVILDQLEQKSAILLRETRLFEGFNYNHFSSLRNQMDLHIEKLQSKGDVSNDINDKYLRMIDRTKEIEKSYNERLSKLTISKVDFDLEKSAIDKEFRNFNITNECIKQLKLSLASKISEIEAKSKSIQSLKKELESTSFQSYSTHHIQHLLNKPFGKLNLNFNKKLFSCSWDSKIKIWDLKTFKCLKTIDTHFSSVNCIIRASETQILSGSADRSIVLWDFEKDVCVRTFFAERGVECLKMLTETKFASGGYNGIKIWNINEPIRCLKTMDEHKDVVHSLELAPNGNLISSSEDSTIKIWNIEEGKCLKTLTDHTDSVFRILLLETGDLASASNDMSIKLWDMKTGKCKRTFTEYPCEHKLSHSGTVTSLEQRNPNELISCSADGTIKFWNLLNGKHIRTLVGHTDSIFGIKVNDLDQLVSCSRDRTIKFWDLITGQCTHTIHAHNLDVFGLLII